MGGIFYRAPQFINNKKHAVNHSSATHTHTHTETWNSRVWLKLLHAISNALWTVNSWQKTRLTVHKNTTCSPRQVSHDKMLIFLPAMFKGKVITNQTQKKMNILPIFNTKRLMDIRQCWWKYAEQKVRGVAIFNNTIIWASSYHFFLPHKFFHSLKEKLVRCRAWYYSFSYAMQEWRYDLLVLLAIVTFIYYTRFFHMPLIIQICHNWWP